MDDRLRGTTALVWEGDPVFANLLTKGLSKLGVRVSRFFYWSELLEKGSTKRDWLFANQFLWDNRDEKQKTQWQQWLLGQPQIKIFCYHTAPPNKQTANNAATSMVSKTALSGYGDEIICSLALPRKDKDWQELAQKMLAASVQSIGEKSMQKSVTQHPVTPSLSDQIAQYPLQSSDPLVRLLRPYALFQSRAMLQSLRFLPQIARAPFPVLIQGETGTGKEMIARAVHDFSPFCHAPYLAMNCGAIPENLIESELFGHEKGSFTGASYSRKGKFELAHGGSLFLDEIGEMPLNMQVRLLRALEEGTVTPIGAHKPIVAKPRIIAATQVDLDKAQKSGLFRPDLYYRLNILYIVLPPLRYRKEDIPLLAWHFFQDTLEKTDYPKPYPAFDDEAFELLQAHPWPGNVRELKNFMIRVAALLPPNLEHISAKHLWLWLSKENFAHLWEKKPQKAEFTVLTPQSSSVASRFDESEEPTMGHVQIPIGLSMKDAKKVIIEQYRQHFRGNLQKTAEALQMSERHLRRFYADMDKNDG